MSDISITDTTIDGLMRIDLSVREDGRGWFKENFHAEKLEAAGLRGFRPVQNNISFNKERGVTRGLHAEPWEKYISLATGKAFVAIVDLRPGSGLGRVECLELDPSVALFVPRGCANSFQVLEANTAYTYLVNDHWSPDARYEMVNLFDPDLAIDWPIPKSEAIVSDKDQLHPMFADFVRSRDANN